MTSDDLRRYGRLLLLLGAVVWLLFGIGEMASGEPSGALHLVPAAVLAAMAVLARAQPLAVAAMLVAIGVAIAAVQLFTNPELTGWGTGLIAAAAPPIVSAVLLAASALRERRAGALS